MTNEQDRLPHEVEIAIVRYANAVAALESAEALRAAGAPVDVERRKENVGRTLIELRAAIRAYAQDGAA